MFKNANPAGRKSQSDGLSMNQIKSILVANRGEIAVRIMRTAKAMGIHSIGVYSEPDAKSLHAITADIAVALAGQTAQETYLDIEKIISAAKYAKADAIHPGYGFLSENPGFAKACEAADIIFIGPSAAAIELMGSKRLAKSAVEKIGAPTIQGYNGDEQNPDALRQKATSIGFPLMIKASAGGGGRGMRLVSDVSQFDQALSAAKTEALNSFGDDEILLEQAVIEPSHIEIQVFADRFGNVVHLGERDCSIQRRHQKIVEEAPSPRMSSELREAMGQCAVNIAKACDYVGAGTVEFLLDKQQRFYFLEMNTRLQVEHPVTEMITGFDLVEWQIKIAEGQPLPIQQDQLLLKGHAIELRVYAEDPRSGFLPQAGKVLKWRPSTELRVDSGIRDGQAVSSFYDPMLAKLIVHAPDRPQAIRKMIAELERTVLLGIDHNLAFLRDLIAKPAFMQSSVNTAFLSQEYDDGEYQAAEASKASVLVAALVLFRQTELNHEYAKFAWRSAVPMRYAIRLQYKGTSHELFVAKNKDTYEIEFDQEKTLAEWGASKRSGALDSVKLNNKEYSFRSHNEQHVVYIQDQAGHYCFEDITYRPATSETDQAESSIKASMDGAIVGLYVKPGQEIEANQLLVELEAMKMVHQYRAPAKARVVSVGVKSAEQVKTNQVLIELDFMKEPSAHKEPSADKGPSVP